MMKSSFTMPFAGSDLDECEHKRGQAELEAFLNDDSACAILFDQGRPSLRPTGGLKMVHPKSLVGQNIADPGPLFLGTRDGVPIFAFHIARENDVTEAESFQDMRVVARQLSPTELALAGRAKALLEWHASHTYCAKCSKQSFPQRGGTSRKCPACGTDHFPRVNPVTIMLVINGDQCLLGRGHGWPDKTYSALAGFISPGETIEEGCAREIFEEVGVTVTNQRYVFSQPWPFPSQLMIGLICETTDTELKIDPKEIEDAKWFTREQVEAVFAKRSEVFKRPPRFTIAHQLLRHWLAETD